jgi:hypothetical protein
VAGYNNAIDQTRAGTAQSIGYLQPFAQAGQGGSKLLSDAFGINGPDAQKAYYAGFQTDPGYEATLRGGTQALDQGAASVGNLRSGGAMKDLFSYGQQQMQGQFQDRLTRLLGVSSQGQNAATTMGGYSQQGSQDIANYLAQQGGALGQGTINAGNATMGGITGAADWNSGGILGAANSNISGFLGATNARTNAMQNSSWLNQYGAGQMAGVANDLAGKFSSPLSQYAGKAASSFHAPTSGLVF